MESVETGVIHTGRWRRYARLWRFAPWIAGVLLVVGIVMTIVTLTSGPSSPASSPATKPPTAPVTPKSVPLSTAARSVAREFVTTAVARKDLAAAWKISGPNIRGGLTYAEWKTGNIPVIPYPVASVQYGAPFKIDFSYPNEALLEVALLPKPSVKIKPAIFDLLLRLIPGAGGKQHWVVDSWVPHSSTLVPAAG
jgi:hypothetical protein